MPLFLSRLMNHAVADTSDDDDDDDDDDNDGHSCCYCALHIVRTCMDYEFDLFATSMGGG